MVDAHPQHQLVHQPRGPGDDVEMAIGDGVEGAGIESLCVPCQRPLNAIQMPPPMRKQPLTISSARMRERDRKAPAFPAISA